MKQTLITAGTAVATIQGIELAQLNEGFSLVSTIVVTIVALIRLFKKKPKQETTKWEETPLYPTDENGNKEIF